MDALFPGYLFDRIINFYDHYGCGTASFNTAWLKSLAFLIYKYVVGKPSFCHPLYYALLYVPHEVDPHA